jgi:hypothetical protein
LIADIHNRTWSIDIDLVFEVYNFDGVPFVFHVVYGSVNPVPALEAICHPAAGRTHELQVMLHAEQRLFGTWEPFCMWSDEEKLSESLMSVTRCGVPIRLNMHGLRSPVI